jgi:hypothetical protein
MPNLSTAQRLGVLLALVAMIASTRMSHFGSASLLPDASLAMFLLGGIMLGGVAGFIVLMLATFGLDIYMAQSSAEVAWCFSPAYAGLIPTYAVLWLSGIGLAQQQRFVRPLLALVASSAAVGVAFLISNGFYFMLSGVASSVSLSEFALAVTPYFPAYLTSAMLYLAPAALAAAWWQNSNTRRLPGSCRAD